MLLRQLQRFGFGFVKVGTKQISLTAKRPHRINFDIRRGNRHHNQGFDAQLARRQRNALSMVTRRRGHHALRFLIFIQPGDHRVGTTQLEAVYRLAIFTLN